jgi:hypothetical protein
MHWQGTFSGFNSFDSPFFEQDDGSAKESFITSSLALLAEKPNVDHVTVKEIKGIAASVYGGKEIWETERVLFAANAFSKYYW